MLLSPLVTLAQDVPSTPADTQPTVESTAPAETATSAPDATSTTDPEPTATATRTFTDPPTIQSDEDDYPPGGRVTLTGGSWQPGETVHIFVNDDHGSSWSRSVDVVADDAGQITDAFNLPDWFVAVYSVRASGPVSGVAATSFTDGNLLFGYAPSGVGNFDVTWTKYTDSNCTVPGGLAPTTDTLQMRSSNFRFAAANAGEWVKLTTESSRNGLNFVSWSGPSGFSSASTTICVPGTSTSATYIANYASVQTTILAVSGATGTYAGSVNLSATLKTSGGAAIGNKTVSFSLNGSPVGTATTNASGVAALSAGLGTINAGTYTTGVGASFTADSSLAGSSGTNQLQVNKAPLTVTADNKSRAYGDANPALTASYSGFVNSQTLSTCGVTGSPSLTTAATDTSPVGAYPITAAQGTLAATNYNFTFVAGTLTVGKANQTISFGALSNKTYGDASFTLVATATSGLSVGFAASPSAVCTVTGSTVTIVGAGDCTVTGSQPGDTNFNPAANVQRSFTVGKATLTVTADDQERTYGAANPAFTATITGFVNDETEADLREAEALTGTPVCGTEATTTSDVGEYDITCALGTLAAANYTFTFATGTLTIEQAATTTTVTCAAGPFTYTGTAHTPCSATVTGPNGLNQALLVSYSNNVNAGTASASASYGATANYLASSDSTTFTIGKATLTVTADDQERTYGAANPAFSASYSGFQNGETLTTSGVTGAPSLTTAATATSPVGPYTITAALGTLAATNYAFEFEDGTLTVGKATIEVNAESKSKIYGAPDPALTYTLAGFKNGEDRTSASVTGTPTCTISAHAEKAGTYTGVITCAPGTLTAANYRFVSGALGSLTISYGFSFLQPINYTAHQTGVTPNTSIFKAGSTVPVKFSLYDVNGKVLACQGPAQWMGAAKGGQISGGVNESLYSEPATTSEAYSCSNGLYQFNWSTKGLAAGYYYRIGVKLDDGTYVFVYIGLK
jgi:hypothetical protein